MNGLCIVCGKQLTGRQTRFCSQKCNNDNNNAEWAKLVRQNEGLSDFDRARDLRRQREVFGVTLRELASRDDVPEPPKRNQSARQLIQRYEQLLGNWKRERSA